MSAFSRNNLIIYFYIGIIVLLILGKNYHQNQAANATKSATTTNTKNSPEEEEELDDSANSLLQQNRPLRMSISVDNPAFLKVRVGQEIKQGDVISDNSTERDRLLKQKQSVTLQIENRKDSGSRVLTKGTLEGEYHRYEPQSASRIRPRKLEPVIKRTTGRDND